MSQTSRRAAKAPVELDGDAEELLRELGGAATATSLLMHADDLSSDDEVTQNTAGKVPRKWYADEPHVGYDMAGGAMRKREGGDRIDLFLRSREDPITHKWTVYDSENDEEITLSRRDVEMIRRLRSNMVAHPEHNMHMEGLELYTSQKQIHPMSSAPEPKRRFLPSKWEGHRINKIVKLIKQGKWKTRKQREEEEAAHKGPEVYQLWDDSGEVLDPMHRGGAPRHIAAPKTRPPGHAASYNPPPEYLFTDEERQMWLRTPAERRPLNFEPRRYESLRRVPRYDEFLQERYTRCLDLYLAPRKIKQKLNVNPQDLLPQLPSPAELRPFPTTRAMVFDTWTRSQRARWEAREARRSARASRRAKALEARDRGEVIEEIVSSDEEDAEAAPAVDLAGREVPLAVGAGRVRCVSFSPTGEYLATGNDDGCVRIFETETGRPVGTWRLQGVVVDVQFSPNPAVHLVAAVASRQVCLIYPGTATLRDAEATWAALVGGEAAEAWRAAGAGAAQGGLPPLPAGEYEVLGVEEEEEAPGAPEVDPRPAPEADLADGEERDEEKDGEHVAKVRRRLVRWRWEEMPATPAGLVWGASDLAAEAAGPRYCGIMLMLTHAKSVKQVRWHRRGDYLVSVQPADPSAAVMLHQLSRRRSLAPLSTRSQDTKGQVQCALFHPLQPLLFVASQRTVRVFSLADQKLVQKLTGGSRWISTLGLHPSGEHLLVGGHDKRVTWFDRELSATPYKTIKAHEEALRAVAFHSARGFPLMATASDDATVHIYHARVSDDWNTPPMIVPLRILRPCTRDSTGLSVMDIAWHPRQPWIVVAQSDGRAVMFQDIP